ncbi:MAG: tetratricopeptide repeat protein, partial [Pseudomonadota bacterium]
LNYGVSDQSRNYTAYEHALNVFRTVGNGDILFMNGDNNVFPVTYGRLVERMREDVTLYDRFGIIFRMPELGPRRNVPRLAWEELRNRREKEIIEDKGPINVFYSVFGPYAIDMPDKYLLMPYGILNRVTEKNEFLDPSTTEPLWAYYSTESLYEGFSRDYMNREISAYFHFSRGKHLVLSGQRSLGLKNLELAGRTGFNDDLIHSEMGVFLTDNGFFEEARAALEKALVYHEDLSGVHNNWGYYYHKIGNLEKAIASFQKAIELKPDRFVYHNNLAFAFFEAGQRKEAFQVFEKSLAIHKNQPGIRKFMAENVSEAFLDEPCCCKRAQAWILENLFMHGF